VVLKKPYPQLHCNLRLEKLRCELVQIVAPIDPRMAAIAFARDRREAALLEQFHRAAAGAEQEVILADAHPEQPQSLFQVGVVELGLLSLNPSFSGGCNLCRGIRRWRAARARSLTRKDVEQARTEDADVTELLQIRQRDVERLIAAHREAR